MCLTAERGIEPAQGGSGETGTKRRKVPGAHTFFKAGKWVHLSQNSELLEPIKKTF